MRPRRIGRIARWEIGRAGTLDRRSVLAGLLALVLLAGVVPVVASQGVALEDGIYRVGVAPESPYYAPVAADPTFAVGEPRRTAYERGALEVLVADGRLYARDTEKGRAAVSALRDAVERYNDRQMAREENRSAAFPVTVSLLYVDRGTAVGTGAGGGGGGGDDGGDGADDGGGTDGDAAAGGGGPLGIGGAPLGGLLGTERSIGTPGEITPPFPFGALVLSFVFVIPLNFVIQAYGSSILRERINRRGELLLVAPVSRGEIIAGKTLPYLGAAIGIAIVIAVIIGGGPLSVLAVAPLALLFLGATFLGAMFARSFKELTFVTTSIAVLLTAYAFVPAIFTDVGPIALISPLTLAVRDLSNEAMGPLEVGFALVPATLVAAVLFGLGAGLYREEDMFTQRAVHLKALDALAGRIARVRSLVLVTALLVPFVFVTELLAVATLFALPIAVSLPLVLVIVAVVEELAKSAPVLAGFVHDRYPRTTSTALLAGAASGGGFFLGEKVSVIVQLVGLPQIPLARATFATAGVGVGGPLLLILLVAPLALHVVTTAIAALGAARGRLDYGIGLSGAILLHVTYNLAVVTLLG